MDLTLLTILCIVVGFVFFVMPKLSQADDEFMNELSQLNKSIAKLDEKISEMNNDLARMEKEYVEIERRQHDFMDSNYWPSDIELGV